MVARLISNLGTMPNNGVVGTTPNSCNSLTLLPMNAMDIYDTIPRFNAKSTLRGYLLQFRLFMIPTTLKTESPKLIPATTYSSIYLAKDSMAW